MNTLHIEERDTLQESFLLMRLLCDVEEFIAPGIYKNKMFSLNGRPMVVRSHVVIHIL